MLIAVGGRTEGAESAHTVTGKRSEDGLEPVCFHPMPFEFYSDLIVGFFGKRVFDLSALDDELPYAALCHKVGYIGICYTAEAVDLIENRLKERLKNDMADIKSPMYLVINKIVVYLLRYFSDLTPRSRICESLFPDWARKPYLI